MYLALFKSDVPVGLLFVFALLLPACRCTPKQASSLPSELLREADASTWGRGRWVDLRLDDRSTGSVFLGKPIAISIQATQTNPSQGVSFDLDLDGQTIFPNLIVTGKGINLSMDLKSPVRTS